MISLRVAPRLAPALGGRRVGNQRGVVPMKRSRAGFTLVEVIVVLAILGVMAAVTVPAIRDLRSTDALDHATSVTTTLLARARQTAVERGTPVRVVVDPLGRRYWVRALQPGAAPDSVLADTLDIASDVSLDATATRLAVTFAPSGEAVGDVITLRWRGRAAAVTTDLWTGDARVAQ